ncbi:hypothetical protein HYH03_018955 [Edaphochlamys debaryana]|uniref:Uncharacterized protein n=1 Tax=Edaphochlamys debaryana TaxID=47281 RepID=A0A835XEX5_9CHLO|nr:hypothetical protein HYH03_018955 [Edaphochlamys debaryana]|eukprot:KAG2482099.1 hypothetical protein HYH03_018955 [Edaphochlamys debaryana]
MEEPLLPTPSLGDLIADTPKEWTPAGSPRGGTPVPDGRPRSGVARSSVSTSPKATLVQARPSSRPSSRPGSAVGRGSVTAQLQAVPTAEGSAKAVLSPRQPGSSLRLVTVAAEPSASQLAVATPHDLPAVLGRSMGQGGSGPGSPGAAGRAAHAHPSASPLGPGGGDPSSPSASSLGVGSGAGPFASGRRGALGPVGSQPSFGALSASLADLRVVAVQPPMGGPGAGAGAGAGSGAGLEGGVSSPSAAMAAAMFGGVFGAYGERSGGGGGGGSGLRTQSAGDPSGLSTYSGGGGGGPDPVAACLARYQMHQRIAVGFKHVVEDTRREAEEVEARMLAMSATRSASPGQQASWGEGREATFGGDLEPGAEAEAGPGGAQGPGRSVAQAPLHAAFHGAGPSGRGEQRPPAAEALPDPPHRNRFAPPQPAAARRPASAAPSADGALVAPAHAHAHAHAHSHSQGGGGGGGEGSGSGEDGRTSPPPDGQGPGGGEGPALRRSPSQVQGAYLSLPDGSFAGSAPLKAAPTQEGLLFERYNRRERADLPELQLRYLRPPGAIAPPQPRLLSKVPKPAAPPMRALPNGIPASRLERMSSRRRSRSPPRLYQPQPPDPRTDAVLLNAAAGLGRTAPGLFTLPPPGPGGPPGSPLLGPLAGTGAAGVAPSGPSVSASAGPGSPQGGPRSPKARAAAAAAAAAASDGGALAAYLAVATQPGSGEPLLDSNFYNVLSQHFRSSVMQQTQQLRSALNVNLPLVLGAMNCVNTAEHPGSTLTHGTGHGLGLGLGATGGAGGSRGSSVSGRRA